MPGSVGDMPVIVPLKRTKLVSLICVAIDWPTIVPADAPTAGDVSLNADGTYTCSLPTQSLSGPFPARASIATCFVCELTPTENVGFSAASAELENANAVMQIAVATLARRSVFI